MIEIRCPWPPTELRPNFIRANHWSKHRHIAKEYRRMCWSLALEQGVHLIQWLKEPLELQYHLRPPKGCRWDFDAREAAFKAGQDGIADAMKLDDRWFRPIKSHGPTIAGGIIIVSIEDSAEVSI